MFDPGIAIGTVLTENEVHETFECQTTLGIRMSKKNNLFVIMSGSAKKQIYHDRWVDDVLYYNGTDINSDTSANQTLIRGKGNNNSQLYDVWFADEASRPQIFLFVKRIANQCVYKGEVVLDREPFIEDRGDNSGRKVWIFPLKLKSFDATLNEDRYEQQEDRALSDDLTRLKTIAENNARMQPAGATTKHRAITNVYERSPYVSAYAKIRTKGYCDLCCKRGPFDDKEGRPYLESHHVQWLSRGGKDVIDNIVALCPNCHRKMHILDDPIDVAALKERIRIYSASL